MREKGSTLIEVLVSMTITAIALLGFMAMQTKSLLMSQDAYSRTQASSFAQEIIQRIRMNPTVLDEYSNAKNWQGAIQNTSCFAKEKTILLICDEKNMALYDITEVRSLLEGNGGMPAIANPSILVQKKSEKNAVVFVAWNDMTATQCTQSVNAGGGGLKLASCYSNTFLVN